MIFTKSRLKMFAKSPDEWQNDTHDNIYIILFRLIISPFSPRNVFLLDIVASPQLNLWRHANARNCHCDAIFVYCSCTHELSQGLSSLMNNNREYWFPATHYSRPRVCVRNWYLACARNGYITIWWYTTGITCVQWTVCENQIRICCDYNRLLTSQTPSQRSLFLRTKWKLYR